MNTTGRISRATWAQVRGVGEELTERDKVPYSDPRP
jgi:hypothetical protein